MFCAETAQQTSPRGVVCGTDGGFENNQLVAHFSSFFKRTLSSWLIASTSNNDRHQTFRFLRSKTKQHYASSFSFLNRAWITHARVIQDLIRKYCKPKLPSMPRACALLYYDWRVIRFPVCKIAQTKTQRRYRKNNCAKNDSFFSHHGHTITHFHTLQNKFN
jgi:hypothetical protein